jgi:alpha-tubulin suppressor-like RCC1 family protein
LVNISFADAASPIKKLVVSNGFSLILMEDGKLLIRGDYFFDRYDELGFAELDNGNDNWKDIAASGSSIYGIKEDGTMWANGLNDVGQLGTGDTIRGKKMRQIGKNRKWKMVSSEYAHVAAIAEDGSLWTWGLNGAGQIGDGTLNNRYVPTRVGNSKDWVEVQTGTWNTVAVKNDGSVWAWGNTWASIKY